MSKLLVSLDLRLVPIGSVSPAAAEQQFTAVSTWTNQTTNKSINGLLNCTLRCRTANWSRLRKTLSHSPMRADKPCRGNFGRRHLGPLPEQSNDGEDAVEWEDLVVLKQFRDLPEALLAKGSLASAGIESFLADDNMVRMDWFISNLVGGIKLSVRPQDADTALEMLEQPIPADLEVEGEGAYRQPACPHCESLDISFEALHKPASYTAAWVGIPIPFPRRRWKCQSCGHKWRDAEDE